MGDVADLDVPGWAPGGANWGGLNVLLRRKSAFSPELDADAAEATQRFMRETCQVLVIGAGGLGCEVLKDLALSGFRRIEVVDMDVIDVTNLNRQFLFRAADVGLSKADVAAKFVNARVPGAQVIPHREDITKLPPSFFEKFHLIVGGLDSIDARRWLNGVLVDLAEVDEDGAVRHSTLVPFVDGGSEGLLGQARVILPRISACFECTLALFPPARTFPLCTIANTPRLPEHCVEYAHVVLWSREAPFGADTKLDTDNPEHMGWLYEQAAQRATEFGIAGVTLRLTQGVVKNIIPAVASTNAIIAAACAHEALKMVTYIAHSMDNYMMYNGTQGVYSFTYRNEKRADCPVCGVPTVKQMSFSGQATLAEFLEHIAEDADLRSRKPFLRSVNGMTLYASTPEVLRAATENNLTRKMSDLATSGSRLTLTDTSMPTPRTIELTLT